MAAKKKGDEPKLVRVKTRRRSSGTPAGSVLHLEPDHAEYLIRNGHVVRWSVEAEESELEAGILSAPDFSDL